MYGDGESVEEVVKRYVCESARIVKPREMVLVGTKHGIPANKAQEMYLDQTLGKRIAYVFIEMMLGFVNSTYSALNCPRRAV